jgi:hypothetical protein
MTIDLSIIDLSTSQELQLRLDPVASEDRFPSVAFDIEAKLTMPFPQTTISIKQCWFSHTDLNRFEEGLGTLCHQASKGAELTTGLSRVDAECGKE